VPYVVALTLVRGRVGLGNFYDEPLDAAEIIALTEKTWWIDDPASDFPKRFPGKVIVHLADGRVVRSRKAASFGSPDVPLPTATTVAKFVSNATRVIGRASAERLVDAVLHLESEESLERISALCTVT